MLNDVQPNIKKVRGKMLIAMPHLADPRFYHTTLAMYKHDDEGAGGLIFNKPAKSLVLGDLFDELQIPLVVPIEDTPIYYGGPVRTNQVFVLHSHEYLDQDTIAIATGISMTTNKNILFSIANGVGPTSYKLCLGCAIWGPQQLESEISGAWQHNDLSSWLYSDLQSDIVFSNLNAWPTAVESYSKNVAGNILNYMEKKHASTSKS